MKHEELYLRLRKTKPYFQTKALKAVIEMHKPNEKYPFLCNGCYEEESGPADYPCPTIQAIEKELA